MGHRYIVHFSGEWENFDDGEDSGGNNDDDVEIVDGLGADDVADCQKSLPADWGLASLSEVIWSLRI